MLFSTATICQLIPLQKPNPVNLYQICHISDVLLEALGVIKIDNAIIRTFRKYEKCPQIEIENLLVFKYIIVLGIVL